MTENVPVAARTTTARELRRRRARSLALRVLLGVGAPTLLTAAYLGLFAAPRYESITTFTIRSSERSAPPSALLSLFAEVPGDTTRDALLALEYIESRDMLRHLVAEHRFLAHYSAPRGLDLLYRLSPDAGFEDTYDYYLHRVAVQHDTASNALTLRVQAFDAATAERLSEAILRAAERRVDELSAAARQDRIGHAERELATSEARLVQARQRLREVQSQHGSLDPVATAQAVLEVRSRLEAELAIARADRSTAAATLPRSDPGAVAARRRVAALEAQVEEQSERLAGARSESIRAQLTTFEPAIVEKEFAQRAYESALAALEMARLDASRRHRYLVRVAGPSRPVEAAYPLVWRGVLTVFVASLLLLGVGSLLLASVREHANL